ncbi:hypothetical protein ACFFHJ_19390 [Planotetraspora thailandica]|nr:hypothetical protein [Planotetraspora thailandica]
MTWIFVAVGLAMAGLSVLGFLSARVFVAARGLGLEIDRARQRLAPFSGEFSGERSDEQRVAIGANREGRG